MHLHRKMPADLTGSTGKSGRKNIYIRPEASLKFLGENRKLADSVAKAFSEACKAMPEHRREAAGSETA